MASFDERLAAVPWSTLNHAYGPASDVPAMLHALRSSDPDTRAAAYFDGLIAALWHQGTTYPASAFAVPFLVELLGNKDTPCRGRIAATLALLAMAAKRAVAEGSPAPDRPYGDALLHQLALGRRTLLSVLETEGELRDALVITLAQLRDDDDFIANHLRERGSTAQLELLRRASASPDTAWEEFRRLDGLEDDDEA